MAEEIRPLQSDEEVGRRYDMTSQAFREPLARSRRWRAGANPADFRGLFVDGELRVVLNLIPLPTWFGTAPVPCAGLSGVATPPEYRRQGYIGRLLRATLEELRATSRPLSSPHPF